MGAIRIARAYTKRKKIVRFDGHFHGWSDQLASEFAGIPEEVHANTTVISENSIDALTDVVRRENPAAVIFHFVYGSAGGCMAMGDEDPIQFMKAMRELTSKHGVLLIADEVITGFRLARGGGQEYFGIDVDLATLGKIVGGSIGGSGAIVGKEEIMSVADPKKQGLGEVPFTGGTFSGNPLNSAAGYAALDVIDRADGILNEHANKLGERLRNGLNSVFRKYEFPAQAVGCGSCNSVAFTDKLPIKSVTEYKQRQNHGVLYKWHMYLAVHYGIYTYPGGGAFYIMTPHTNEDIDRVIAATEDFVKKEKGG
jgi:glutamate-1-semialdehyde 2,1-aminomutase